MANDIIFLLPASEKSISVNKGKKAFSKQCNVINFNPASVQNCAKLDCIAKIAKDPSVSS